MGISQHQTALKLRNVGQCIVNIHHTPFFKIAFERICKTRIGKSTIGVKLETLPTVSRTRFNTLHQCRSPIEHIAGSCAARCRHIRT